jgi:pteridine reductase
MHEIMSDQSNDLSGKVALITGASRRIGAEIARTLHRAGMNLCIHYRSSEADAQQLVDELHSIRKNSAIKVQMDLLQTEALAELVSKAASEWGRLDLLLNNASTYFPTSVADFTGKDWDILMGSNLKAPLFLSQAAAPVLAENQGSIINIIDIFAERPKLGHTLYSIAKSGLLTMTRSLARELGPDVRVNGVGPGAILSAEHETTSAAEHVQQEVLNQTALKRWGDPADIAAAVLFLLRDAPYVTGHMIPVDGGRLLYI